MKTNPRKERRCCRQSNLAPPVFLPDELITEILSCLRVKSLMKMKCVCKSWKTLISDSKFVKIHLNRSFARNPCFSLVMYNRPTETDDCSFMPFSISSLLENRYITPLKDPHYQLNDKGCREVVGSCNGLVCLLGYSLANDNAVVWLRFWNPATRKISDKLGYLHADNYRRNSWMFVFGYDDSTNTYKIVALNCEDVLRNVLRKPEVNMSIFSLGDNVWRSIKSLNIVPFQLISPYSRVHDGVHFSSTINWLAPCFCPNRVSKTMIVSLDLSTETYTQLMPPQSCENMPGADGSVCVFMNSFCFYHNMINGTDFIIWKMMKFGDDKSWTQFLKFNNDNLRVNCEIRFAHLIPLHLFKNGDTLVFANSLQDRAILYNWRNNIVLKPRVNNNKCWFSINCYVESLVSTC
ncbi:putative F-box domain-containing protein [Medicago truncatula]|uniref:F-box protein interaction domain protein n=1 Tax=Medicago truncatula TaxID=3880 RepID=A0A072U0U1_MEDTR|nr:F-box protein interaction domain protein [Medicago truncatula]RHN45929.1 putative F-box domain-containing protein [Medicago truncatula]